MSAIMIAAWDEDDFLARGGYGELPPADPPFIWAPGSYSKAWHDLAEIALRDGQLEEALACVEKGLELEPDHPSLWCAKGYLFDSLERHEEALECYIRAISWDRPLFGSQVARALYRQAMQLIALGRLLEAESALKEVLKVNPDDEDASNELFDLEEIRIDRMLREDAARRKQP